MNRSVLILTGGVALVLALLAVRPTHLSSETSASLGELPKRLAGATRAPTPPSTRSVAGRTRSSDSPEFRIPQPLSELTWLARTDPPGALDALEALLSNSQPSHLDQTIVWLAENPGVASSWIESLPEGPVRNGIVERLLPEVTSQSTSTALKIAESLGQPELRDSALSAVIRRWAAAAPTEALSLIAAREEWRETPLMGRAFIAAATAYPERIEQLFALIPPETLDESFLSHATETLLARDPSAVARWFAIIENTSHRGAIAETIMLHAGRNDPALAFVWATQLADSDSKLGTLQGILYRAVGHNPAAAPALLDCASLSAEDRESLLLWLGQTEPAEQITLE